jgi:hypothetical protein
VVALGFGLAAALVLGEGLARLAAWWSPAVRDLAVPRHARPAQAFNSLEAYLASQPTQVVPHRNWFNYWNNALGFNDEEFDVPKPTGRFRIMAVGDSSTFGLVPYPDSAMALLEARLRAVCRGSDLDVLNFGIGGTGVDDYRAIVTLGFATYAPDLVVVHFYAGNDGPDAYRLAHERSQRLSLLGHSRLWTFARNVIRLRRHVPEAVRAPGNRPAQRDPGGPAPRGGAVVDPGHPLRQDDLALVGPIFDAEAFDAILGQELRRLYVPPDPAMLERAWQPVIGALDAIRDRVSRGQARLALVVYPSVLQVNATMREQLVRRLHERGSYVPLTLAAVDPELPQKRLAAYCRRVGLPCFDLTPAFIRAHHDAPSAALYKQRDAHWTPLGNAVAAEAEAGHLGPLVCSAVGPVSRREGGRWRAKAVGARERCTASSGRTSGSRWPPELSVSRSSAGGGRRRSRQ